MARGGTRSGECSELEEATKYSREYAEAQKTILTHNSKIKNKVSETCRAEITAEKERHSVQEKSQQARVAQQNNAMETAKGKIALLEKQIEGLKVSSTTQLEGEKVQLERHIATLSAKNSALTSDMTRLTTQVSVLEKEVDSLREALKKKSKEKAKTPQPEAHSQTNGDGTEMERLKASLQKCPGEGQEGTGKKVEELSAQKGASTVVDEGLQGAEQSDSELAKALAEKEELRQQIVQLEQKLNDLKEKNNGLRDSTWKARDDAAAAEKASKDHLTKMMAEAEKRCKQAKKEGITEAQVAHKATVQRLFPDVTSDEKDFSRWIDGVERAVKEQLDQHKQETEQLSFLRQHVQELEGSERRMISEAQHLRDTLKNSMDVMERVKEKVEITSQSQQKDLQEEKQKNKQLEEQLKTEQSVAKQLQEQLAQKDASLKEAELNYRTEKDNLLQLDTDATQKQLGEQIEKNRQLAHRPSH
eukprot:Em0916g1a